MYLQHLETSKNRRKIGENTKIIKLLQHMASTSSTKFICVCYIFKESTQHRIIQGEQKLVLDTQLTIATSRAFLRYKTHAHLLQH